MKRNLKSSVSEVEIVIEKSKTYNGKSLVIDQIPAGLLQ
jgi:hypothetical protein